MDLETFRQRRKQLEQSVKTRNLCTRCLQPDFSCYCEHIKSFDPKIKFAILIHPIEAKRRIATGRMSHLSLQNSELIVGQDYTNNETVNSLLSDSEFSPTVLYPGPNSINLTNATELNKAALCKNRLLVFVIDGTWATAKKTMHLSTNLKSLPRISFSPPKQSQFRVRKQPGVECYSTIEAIHHTLELLGPSVGFDTSSGTHNSLIATFDKMVERQIQFAQEAFDSPRGNSYRRPSKRIA